jgi:hypothetical protein
MKMEQCSETSAYKIQTPGNCPEESVQHSEQGESLKSRINTYFQKKFFQQFNLFNKGKRREEKRRLGGHCDRHCVYYWQTKFLNAVEGPR